MGGEISFWPLVRPRHSFTTLCYLGDFVHVVPNLPILVSSYSSHFLSSLFVSSPTPRSCVRSCELGVHCGEKTWDLILSRRSLWEVK